MTRAHGGLGLGLAIVRHLVELHGGTISANSAGLGKGAAFTVKLPVARQETPATPNSSTPNAQPSELPANGSDRAEQAARPEGRKRDSTKLAKSRRLREAGSSM